MSAKLAGAVTGRRGRFFFLGFWLIVVMATGAVGQNFEKVQKNDYISYLPGSSESVKTLNAIKRFPSGDSIDAIVVFERSSGLTPKDKAVIGSFAQDLKKDPPPNGLKSLGPVVSKSGTTSLVFGSIKIPSDGDGSKQIQSATKDILKRTDAIDDEGLVVKVSGPAGVTYDSMKVFEGLDSTLLLAAASLVFFLLIIIYRSPIFWIVPFISVIFAEGIARGLGYFLAEAGVTINGQSGSIMSVLVFGAGTDYALLLVARYREELRHREDRRDAIRHAVERAAPAVIASAGTVIAGLLCLSFAEVNGTRGLGPIGAMGVAVAMLSMVTFLPALLSVLPRGIFYPFTPHAGDADKVSETRGFWHNVGVKIQRRPRRIWVGMTVALGVCAIGISSLDNDLTESNQFTKDPQSIVGQNIMAKAFPAGLSAPTDVIVPDPAKVAAVTAALEKMPEVAQVQLLEKGKPGIHLSVTLKDDPYSTAAYKLIPQLRKIAEKAGGQDVLVGGQTAIQADLRKASERDVEVIPPIVLLVIFLILALLLRAIAAPFMLILTVLLSFAATLGLSSLAFEFIFNYPGSDPSLALYAFIFLVALGVDYNIFLMARAHEESAKHGTHTGMLRALSVTGAVITSAGIVLAGTFLVLATLPVISIAQIGFAVALGVLLDTFLVRSILVPALTFDIGDRVWWPSALGRRGNVPDTDPSDTD